MDKKSWKNWAAFSPVLTTIFFQNRMAAKDLENWAAFSPVWIIVGEF